MRVLVIEDNAMVRRMFVRIAEALGWDVFTADDADAVAMWSADEKALLNRIDTVISDCDAPRDGSGADLLLAIRMSHPSVRRVLMSGRTEDDDVVRRAIDGGVAHAFLAKPFTVDDLFRAAIEVKGGGREGSD